MCDHNLSQNYDFYNDLLHINCAKKVFSWSRNKDPFLNLGFTYALPVSCIPYGSLTESKARTHLKSVISEMQKRKMKVAGKLTAISM